jgi:hypothetical protein
LRDLSSLKGNAKETEGIFRFSNDESLVFQQTIPIGIYITKKKFFVKRITFYINVALFLALGGICTGQSSSDKKIENLLQKMTLEEKIGQLNQYTAGWNTGTPTTRF